MEASGANGSVETRATKIRNSAVDPGIDGMENVVHPGSAIMSKARSTSLATEKTGESFISGFASSTPGISIILDSGLSLVAAKGNTSSKNKADKTKQELNKQYNSLKSEMSASI